ncbi:polysaccharide deacetylase family protein [Actinomycetospora termitidis]|uniref:Polysaccharide deacetylase n=1 Tax=Actinomycetospora termitidis TaxID=3053470 RepID=A0ABT7M4M3_9PSEU|nr:polysaccharide deacetylase [Actinomycetospora sp. Odt1-22]MDL5155632.1 polysaccharide deacetylase [Actinomycetospora sp. Odt1-22]
MSDLGFSWPAGRRAAAAFTFDVDAESCALAHDPSSADRMSLMTHQSYGPRVAVPRLLGILADHGVSATFFVPGYTAEQHPGMVRAIVEAGHEIGHHGYLHENMLGLDPAAEAAVLDRGLDVLRDVAGVVPTGYRAPWWEMNWHTPALLADRGFVYDSSLLDGDRPYRMAAGAGTLVEIPVDWALDDWEQYAFFPGWTGSGVIEDPAKARDLWAGEARAHHRLGGCFVLTNHPFLSGRPGRATALDELIDLVVGFEGMWVTTLGEIAEQARRTCTDTWTHHRPELPAPAGVVPHREENP